MNRRILLVVIVAIFVTLLLSGILSVWYSDAAMPVLFGSCIFFTIPLLIALISETYRTRLFWTVLLAAILLGLTVAYFVLPYIPPSVYTTALYIFLVPLGIYAAIFGLILLIRVSSMSLRSRNLDSRLAQIDNYDNFADFMDSESSYLLEQSRGLLRPLSRRSNANFILRRPDEGQASNFFEEILWRIARSIGAPLDPLKALPAEIAEKKAETLWNKLEPKRSFILGAGIILAATLPPLLLSFFYKPVWEWFWMDILFPSLAIIILRLPLRGSHLSNSVYLLDTPFYIGTTIPFALILNLPEPFRMGLSLPYLLIVIYFWLVLLAVSPKNNAGDLFYAVFPIIAYFVLVLFSWGDLASLGILGMMLIPIVQVPLWILLFAYLSRTADRPGRTALRNDANVVFDDI